MKRASRRKTYRDMSAYIAAQPRDKTQVQIAEELGIAPSQLSQLKLGSRGVNGGLARRLARVCRVPIETLLRPEDV